MEFINSIYEEKSSVLFLCVGSLRTALAVFDPEKKRLMPVCFDESEKDYSIATAVFYSLGTKSYVIGNQAVSMYQNGVPGELYENFADDINRMSEPVHKCVAGTDASQGGSVRELTNKDVLEIFMKRITQLLSNPAIEKINNLSGSMPNRMFVLLGDAMATFNQEGWQRINGKESGYCGIEWKTVNPIKCFLNFLKGDLVWTEKEKLKLYQCGERSILTLGDFPSPEWLVNHFIKLLCMRKRNEMPEKVRILCKEEPALEVISRLKDTAEHPKCSRSKIYVIVDDEDEEIPIRFSENDLEFFLYQMPFLYEGNTYCGAKSGTLQILLGLTSSGGRQTHLLAGCGYSEIWDKDPALKGAFLSVSYSNSAFWLDRMMKGYDEEKHLKYFIINQIGITQTQLKKKLPFPMLSAEIDVIYKDFRDRVIVPVIRQWMASPNDSSIAYCGRCIKQNLEQYVVKYMWVPGHELFEKFSIYGDLLQVIDTVNAYYDEQFQNMFGEKPQEYYHNYSKLREIQQSYFGHSWWSAFSQFDDIQIEINKIAIANGYDRNWALNGAARRQCGLALLDKLDTYLLSWKKRYLKSTVEKIDRTCMLSFINEITEVYKEDFKIMIDRYLQAQ